jgi:hypothetical protein
MNSHHIIFTIDSSAHIIVENRQPIDLLPCFCETPIIFKQPGCEYILTIDNIRENMRVFYEQLSRTLRNDLILHKSIRGDIGRAYNSYRRYTDDENPPDGKGDPFIPLYYVQRDGLENWIGHDYALWGYESNASWLYNAPDGSIIFEITLVYPGAFASKNTEATIMPYHKWIKTYTSYYVKKIPRDIAEQWLKQARSIVRRIDAIIDSSRHLTNC